MIHKTRIYVAGPMSGLPEFNYPAFHEAARRLRALAYAVENPAECLGGAGWDWRDYMRACIPQLLMCNAVALLPGWEDSKGARTERGLALALEYDVRPANEWGAS
jgi:hypothetical protein